MSGNETRSFFQSDLYVRHNARRLEHLAALHLDLAGKTVLELGAGIGDHSIFYLDRGCAVTAIEPRAGNIEVLHNRMREFPDAWNPSRLRVIQADVERLDNIDALGTFDVVHCYGLLYHLNDPVHVLRMAAARCRGIFLLETKVRLDHHPSSITEDRENPTNSVQGPVTLLTREELLARLAEQFVHVYVPTLPVWHEQFPTAWDSVPADRWPIRAVVVCAREPLTSSSLQEVFVQKIS